MASVLIINVAEWADAGALDQLMEVLADGKATPADVSERLGDPRLALGLVRASNLAGLLAIPFWHAPALVHWGRRVRRSRSSQHRGDLAQPERLPRLRAGWAAVVLTTGAAVNLLGVLLGHPQLIAVLAMPASLLLDRLLTPRCISASPTASPRAMQRNPPTDESQP